MATRLTVLTVASALVLGTVWTGTVASAQTAATVQKPAPAAAQKPAAPAAQAQPQPAAPRPGLMAGAGRGPMGPGAGAMGQGMGQRMGQGRAWTGPRMDGLVRRITARVERSLERRWRQRGMGRMGQFDRRGRGQASGQMDPRMGQGGPGMGRGMGRGMGQGGPGMGPGAGPMRPGAGPRGGGLAGILGRLDLTQAQRDQVKAFGDQHQKDATPIREKIQAAQQKLNEAMGAPVPDEAAVRAAGGALSTAQVDMFALQARHQAQIMKVLTPEQQQQASQWLKQQRPGAPAGPPRGPARGPGRGGQ